MGLLMATAAVPWAKVRDMRGNVVAAVRLGLLAAFFAPLLHPHTANAQADGTHYQTLQLGERSRGMAAAYTAYAADGVRSSATGPTG